MGDYIAFATIVSHHDDDDDECDTQQHLDDYQYTLVDCFEDMPFDFLSIHSCHRAEG
jgi:hypothetical protein